MDNEIENTIKMSDRQYFIMSFIILAITAGFRRGVYVVAWNPMFVPLNYSL